jgi:hypothetical protein
MRVLRLSFVGSLTLALLLVGGCESSNKGKIVGKWECMDVSMFTATQLEQGYKRIVEFTPDQNFSIYTTVKGQTIDVTTKGTYRLGLGDNVILENLNPPLEGQTHTTEIIKINGYDMKMKNKDAWTKFERISETPAKKAREDQ